MYVNVCRDDDVGLNHYESVNIQHQQLQQHSPHHPGGKRPAATATRELDDLMASLSEFKVS